MNSDDLENPETTPRAETSPVIPPGPAEHSDAEPVETATSVEHRPAQTEKLEFVREAVSAEDSTETEMEVWPPTLKAEALRDKMRVSKIARLITKARFALSRGKEANLEAGRNYEELRPLFTYGTWLPFLKSEASMFGLSYRTIQDFMKQARETDNPEKYAKSAHCVAEDPNTIAENLEAVIAEKETEAANAAASKYAQRKPEPAELDGLSASAPTSSDNDACDEEQEPADGERVAPTSTGIAEGQVESDLKPSEPEGDIEPGPEPQQPPAPPPVLMHIPLLIPASWRDGLNNLMASQNWKVAEMEYRALSRRLLVWFKYLDEPSGPKVTDGGASHTMWPSSERPNHENDMA